jgi:riboflavin kinase
MSETAVAAVGHDELAALRTLALSGALDGDLKTSCRSLSERLDVSDQTVSRRLRRLAEAGYVDRETVSDGQFVAITDEGERVLRREYERYRRVFEGDRVVRLEGQVTDGMGEGRHYVTLSGYAEQFRERLGYEPFPGTLNVDLTEESVRRRSGIDAIEAVHIEGWEDEERTYGPADCIPAAVEADGERYEGAHAIVPERTHHDEDQLELIAPDRLREELDLDGDAPVVVEVGR